MARAQNVNPPFLFSPRLVILGNLQAQSPNIPLLHPFFNIGKIIENQKHPKNSPNVFGGTYLHLEQG